jgi:hypothetical protein
MMIYFCIINFKVFYYNKYKILFLIISTYCSHYQRYNCIELTSQREYIRTTIIENFFLYGIISINISKHNEYSIILVI